MLPDCGVAKRLGVTIDQRVASRQQGRIGRVAFDHVAQLAEVVDQQAQASLVLIGRLQSLQQIRDEVFEFGFFDIECDLEGAFELDSGGCVALRLVEHRFLIEHGSDQVQRADVARFVTRHREPEILQARFARKDLREAHIQRHALFFQCDRRIEDFARRGHRGPMIPSIFAGGKARRPDRGRAVGPPGGIAQLFFRELGRARLANDDDPNLPGIGHVGFDFARHVARQHRGFLVRDLGGLDDHAHLAPGLHGEAFFDALERLRNRFEILEPLDVALEHLAPGSRPRARQRIGRIDQRRQNSLGLDFLMMRGDRVYDLRRLAVFAGDLAADQRVRAFDLVSQRLADIVQQGSATSLLFVQPQLGGHRAADERGFDRMHQHVLRVAVAILEHPEQLDQFGMDSVHADLDDRALTGLANRFLDLLLGLANDFLDTTGMNAAIRDELLESDARYFAPDGVVTGNHHGLGSIVEHYIDAGGRLDRPDIASFAADDAALHLVVGESQHRDRALGDELAGQPLDGDCDDSFGAAVGLLARLFLDDSYVLGSVGARLADHLVHQRALGFLASQAGDGFELGARLVDMGLQQFFFIGEGFLARAQTLIAPVEIGFAPFECFLALFESLLACFELLFDRSYFAPAIAHLALGVGFRADHDILCLEFGLLYYQLVPGLSLLGYFFGLSARGLQVNGVLTLFRYSPNEKDRATNYESQDCRE